MAMILQVKYVRDRFCRDVTKQGSCTFEQIQFCIMDCRQVMWKNKTKETGISINEDMIVDQWNYEQYLNIKTAFKDKDLLPK